jgi:hypothetical protein
MSITEIGNESLDDDLSQYEGSVVIGAHQIADGGISAVQSFSRASDVHIEGYVNRIQVRPDESHIVRQLHEEITEILSDPAKVKAHTVRGEAPTRAILVQHLLGPRLEAYRESQQSKTSTKTSAFEASPVRAGKRERVMRKASVEQVIDEHFPTSSARPQPVPQVQQVAEDLLGIPGLSLDSPPPPQYAMIHSDGGVVKFIYHWGIQVRDSEVLVLVIDRRKREKKSQAAAAKLRQLTPGACRLFLGVSPESAKSCTPITVSNVTQVFDFGDFTFVMLIPEN